MKLIEAYSKLRGLDQKILQTKDVSLILKISVSHASKLLSRLTLYKQIVHLGRGRWVFSDIDPLSLPEALTAPFPAYVSLQTALYYHGMISQIPSTIYAVSVARTRLYKTALATVSIHHLQPNFFYGYEKKNNIVNIATPEKALLDLLYLGTTKTKFFHSLPELEFHKKFNMKKANAIINNITSQRKKTYVKNRFDYLVERWA
jgi:predicted transcriptional regulator of viral defense system